MALTSLGVPMYGADRQQQMAVSMDAAGTHYDYLAQYWTDSHKWNVVVRDFTGASPTVAQIECPALPAGFTGSVYGQLNLSNRVSAQLRASNGRVFLPQTHGYTMYFDPSDEQLHFLPRLIQSPPVPSGTITIYYRGVFDANGDLWMTSSEVNKRPTCITYTNTRTDPPTQTIVGYVGSGALVNSTYGFWIAPDVGTVTRYVYVVYGQSPWQLWALNVDTGATSLLYEVTSTGSMSFTNITDKGWIVTIRTTATDASTQTQWWCLDGALYSYAGTGSDPPSGAPAIRNVTPLTGPLPSGAPTMISPNQAGVVGYRFGTTGAYTYVNYELNNANAITVESLVAGNDTIVGNGAAYAGFFRRNADTTYTWYGTFNSFSQGPRLNVSGIIWGAAYPQGTFVRWDPTAAWNPGTTSSSNPRTLGQFAPQGIQYAGIKYANQLAWAATVGTSGRFYCSGTRERNGTGTGIGYYDVALNSFSGTYYDSASLASAPLAGLDNVYPDGLVVLPSISRVVLSTRTMTGSGTAPLFLFDLDLNHVATLTPMAVSTLGPIFQTSTANVIVGLVQGSGNSLGLWRYNVATQTLLSYVELPAVTGTLKTFVNGEQLGLLWAACQRDNGDVYTVVGTNLVVVNINAMTASIAEDLSSIAPVTAMAFGADTSTLYLAGGTSGSEVFSVAAVNATALDAGRLTLVGYDIVAATAGSSAVTLSGATLTVTGYAATFDNSATDSTLDVGPNRVRLRNGDSSPLTRGQPVCSAGDDDMRAACGDDTGRGAVIGLVCDATVSEAAYGTVAVDGVARATAAEWDAICGTTNGLTTGATYYLDPVTPGRLTATAPTASGQQVAPVMRAMSSTDAVLAIRSPITL